jgi:uncharacterized RDD family membrane protein YckC
MKCPKCLYIGFETGDRCKNCGYDFSLLSIAEEAPLPLAPAPPELAIRPAETATALELSSALDVEWAGPIVDRFRDLPEPHEPAMTLAGPEFDEPFSAPPPMPPAVAAAPIETPAEAPALPLFAPDAADDEPLVKLPATPRAPLAVRRTPETPRLRPTPVARAIHEDAVLQFVAEPDDDEAGEPRGLEDEIDSSEAAPFDAPLATFRRPAFHAEAAVDASPFGKRLTAAIIDHGILLGIDLVVIYFTLRLTGLTFADWHVLPWLPLAAFLMSVKVAYLSAFTTAGGQTIGKMATHIRVVSDDGGGLDPGRALRRAVLGLVSIATAGAPFLTAITDPARRGVHDRASGTRVIALPAR